MTQSIQSIAHFEINIVHIKLHNVLRSLKQDSALPCLARQIQMQFCNPESKDVGTSGFIV